ncbi:MAG: peptidase S41 [Myxococcales bacterium]|nr:peptidase S41 [Myxococcales bacterium]
MKRMWLPSLLCLGLIACDDGPEGNGMFLIEMGAVDDAAHIAEPDADAPDEAVDGALVDAAVDLSLEGCAAAAGDLPDPRPFAVLLSEAHALYRHFGPRAATTDADLALVEAVGEGVDADAAARYAAQTESCLVPADRRAERPTEVTLRDGVAYVLPGAEPPDIPAAAEAVVIDFRGAPAAVLTEAHLMELARAALAAPVPRVSRQRVFVGGPDAIFYRNSVYSMRVDRVQQRDWPGEAPARPVALWLPAKLTPAVAAFAGDLRLARAVWLIGGSVSAALADARWAPLGDEGVLIHTGQRLDARGRPWPPTIPADVAEGAGEAFAVELAAMGAPPAVDAAPAPDDAPAALMRRPGWLVLRDDVRSGQRAALLIAHGTLRRFFPYFDVVGDHIDDRLIETLGAVDAPAEPLDRRAFHRVLRRFAAAIADGHAFVFNLVDPIPTYAPLTIEHLGEQPVIRRSAAAEAQAGDAITAVDGRPVADWYADELPRTSAASHGYALDLASRRYLNRDTPLRLTLRAPDGIERDASIMPVSFDAVPPRTEWLRPTGDLAAEGAAEVFYVNMSGEVEGDTPALLARLDAGLAAADALILDMRGYPGTDVFAVVGRVLGGAARAPRYRVPEWSGPDAWRLADSPVGLPIFGVTADAPGFPGPIALIVGPTSVSAAENFASMLSQAPQVHVIGRPSAATNGNITGMKLPGGWGLTFTGMQVRFPDDTPFHGVGVVPDVEVMPEPADYVEGFDRALQAAIEDVRARL